MRELQDYYTVAIDKLYETGEPEKKIITLNDADISEDQDARRMLYKRLYGTIISGPMGFGTTIVDAIDAGIPEPKAYVNHDFIEARVKTGDRTWGRKDYNPSTYDGYKLVLMEDYVSQVNVRDGDKVYFMETVTEPENALGRTHDGKLIYRLRADSIICSVRPDILNPGKNKIIMQGTWVLVEPDMETWEEITSKAGVIMKVAPQAKYLRATIRHIQPDQQAKPGDLIYYIPDSNWGINVEDVEFFGIREKEILMRVK